MSKARAGEATALRWWTGLAVGALIVLVAGSIIREAHGPMWWLVALLGALVFAAENIGLKFPAPVAISPQLIFVLTAIVALRGDGAILGAAVVGVCGGLHLSVAKARHYVILAFNIGQMGLSAGLAAAAYRYLTTSGVNPGVVYPAVVLVYMAVNYGLVMPAAHIRSGASLGEIWRELRQAQLNDFLFGLAGLGVGRLYLVIGPWAIVIVVGMAVVAQSAFVAVVRVRHAYTRLDLLYRFTRRLERNQDERDAVMSILTELRSLLDASTAELTMLTGAHADGTHAHANGTHANGTHDNGTHPHGTHAHTDGTHADGAHPSRPGSKESGAGWRRTTLSGPSRRPLVTEGTGRPIEADAVATASLLVGELKPEDPVRKAIESRVGNEAMAVATRSERGLLGTIVLGAPAERSFSVEDLRLLEALASHAAVSLENSRLVGQLRYDSHHDQLTGLPNRSRFNELIADLPRPSAVLLTDLDRFKEINDTLGHQYGDLLLTSVARRICDEIGHRGIVARLGGDEFGVLLPQTGSGDAAQIAVSLLTAIERPLQIGELELEITASIGVAVAQDNEDEGGVLLQRADVAMYSAKEAHSGWELYSSERDHYSPRRLTLAGELRRAIETGELEVHFQPKAELATGKIKGMEALVRWRHPRYGIIGPDHFIPVAESAGLIRPLTAFVLVTSLDNQRELRRLGYDLEVAVNLSVRSVLDVNLPNQVAQVLRERGVPPSSLTFEITEGSVMADPARTIGILGRLSQLGVSISVDDFGTGYSSLSYLKRLPATEVKIDRSFVAGMLTNDSDRAIVRSTVDLARNLGLRAVAEGVEDRATWDELSSLGCDYAQGYFVSPPLPVDELRAWLLTTHPAIDPLL